jgi:hypothetical protein
MSDTDMLFDAKRKVERAIAHINSIEKWLWTLNEENREIARAYKQGTPERNLHLVWVKQLSGFSLPLGPMIGDAVHNLRAALDAIAWSIVRGAGGDEADLQKIFFPLLCGSCRLHAISRRFVQQEPKLGQSLPNLCETTKLFPIAIYGRSTNLTASTNIAV